MTKSKGGYKIRPDGKKDTGRPTVMTPKTIEKLEEAYRNGASDIEACLIADIATGTLYKYQNEHPDFIERKEALKKNTSYIAKTVVTKEIKAGNVAVSQWWLERKEKAEFSTRQELTAEDGKNLIPTIEITPVTVINQNKD